MAKEIKTKAEVEQAIVALEITLASLVVDEEKTNQAMAVIRLQQAEIRKEICQLRNWGK